MSAVPPLGALLCRLCPMHVIAGPTGHVLSAGPTLIKIAAPQPLPGARLLERFEVLRPHGADSMAALAALEGARLRLRLRAGPRHALKGVLCRLPRDGALGPAGGVVVDLSFGISVVEAVRDFGLTAADFAATDLATEMLYLLEAKSVAMEESRRLNHRLEGARQAAQEQAFSDPLTGLRNRRAFDQALARFCQGGEPFAHLHLDLDFFKQVNDTHGHAAGDLVLRVAARRMLSILRIDDVLARVGGDEFALLLPGMEEAAALDLVAQRLIAALEEPVRDGAAHYCVSASIGATLSRFHAPGDGPGIVEAADRALYAAKRAGRGRHALHGAPSPPPQAPSGARAAARERPGQGAATRSR